MAHTLDFYFDFSSPYGYMASTQIDDLAHELGRTVNWYPILLGPMFKTMGSAPLVDIPLKGQYARHDFARTAQLFDIPYTTPSPFPIATVAAARATIAVREQHGMQQAGELAKALLKTYFAQGNDISQWPAIHDTASALGLDAEQIQSATQTDAIKNQLKTDVDQAMQRGVFGSPFVWIDGEGFWGFDRLPHVKMWAGKNQA